MLDPQPRVARLGDRLARGGVGVEHQGVPLVADGVRRDLPAVAQGRGRRRLEHLRIDQEQARIAGVVVVRFEQQAAARAHRAVDEELDGPHLEPGAVGASLRAPADELDLAPRRRRCHGVDPDLEQTLAVELAVDLGGAARDTRVVDPGQAGAERQILGREQPAADVEPREAGHGAADQAHRTVDEDARGIAILIAEDLAVGGGLRVLRDLGSPHGLGVGPASVPVDAMEPDRPVRRHRVEHRSGRELAAGPEALVPVPARDP